MNTTSSQLPICVHCGTPRPADETLCPTCGKPWIDTSINDASPPEETPPVAAPVVPVNDDDTPPEEANAAPIVAPLVPPPVVDDTGEFAFDEWSEPEDSRRSVAFWLIALGVGGAAIATILFLFLSGDAEAPTTTISAAGVTSITESTTTTTATTTSELPTTTLAETFPEPSDWPAVGEPIDIDDLDLKAAGIGPIDIGSPIDEAAGALTASLGEADAAGIDGLCPPEESYWLEFGQLTAIFDGYDSAAIFVSYKYDEPEESEIDLGLTTLSGIALGDTVEDLINTYTQYTISFEVIDSKDHFRLSDGGELLLWGPVSSADPEGLIEGIYSPSACDATP